MQQQNETNKRIFETICEEALEADFKMRQEEYLWANKDKFEDTEENKLEYTEIFNGYMAILEQALDKKLHENFTEEEIKAFFEDFSNNFKEYEKESGQHEEILRNIWDFVDFDKFKATILEIKNIDKNANQALPDLPPQEAQFFIDLLNQDVADKQFGWAKTLNYESKESGCRGFFHGKAIEDLGGFPMMRSEMWIDGIRLETWDDFFMNIEKNMLDSPWIDEFKIIDRHENGFLKTYYWKSKEIKGYGARDCVSVLDVQKQADGSALYLNQTIEHPDFPKQEGVIRSAQFGASLVRETPQGLHRLGVQKRSNNGNNSARIGNIVIGSLLTKAQVDFVTKLRKVQADLDQAARQVDAPNDEQKNEDAIMAQE